MGEFFSPYAPAWYNLVAFVQAYLPAIILAPIFILLGSIAPRQHGPVRHLLRFVVVREPKFLTDLIPPRGWRDIDGATHRTIGLIVFVPLVVMLGMSGLVSSKPEAVLCLVLPAILVALPIGLSIRLPIAIWIISQNLALLVVNHVRVLASILKPKLDSQVMTWCLRWLSFLNGKVEVVALTVTTIALVSGFGIFGLSAYSGPRQFHLAAFEMTFSSIVLAVMLAVMGVLDIRFRLAGSDLNEAMNPPFLRARALVFAPVTIPSHFVFRFVRAKYGSFLTSHNDKIAARERAARRKLREATAPKLEAIFEEFAAAPIASRLPERSRVRIKKTVRSSARVAPVPLPRVSARTQGVQKQHDLFAPTWDGDPDTLWAHICSQYPGEPVVGSMVRAILARAKSGS
jgi:hypothetical protein